MSAEDRNSIMKHADSLKNSIKKQNDPSVIQDITVTLLAQALCDLNRIADALEKHGSGTQKLAKELGIRITE